MYDSLALEMPFSHYPKSSNRKEAFDWNRLLFVPRVNEVGEVTGHTSKLENLHLVASDNYKLYIKNSLHKFYKGENYTDFTRSEVSEAISELELFIPNSSRAIVKKNAYGVNYLPNKQSEWLFHLWQPFAPMQAKGNFYGSECRRSEYKIKGYDKEFEVLTQNKNLTKPKIQKGLFRYEIENKYLYRFKNDGYQSLRLEDLAKVEVMQYFAEDLIHQYKLIKMNNVDFRQLESLHEINLVSTMQNPNGLEALRQYSKERYKEYRKKYNQILKRQSKDENLAIIEAKINHLLNA